MTEHRFSAHLSTSSFARPDRITIDNVIICCNLFFFAAVWIANCFSARGFIEKKRVFLARIRVRA